MFIPEAGVRLSEIMFDIKPLAANEFSFSGSGVSRKGKVLIQGTAGPDPVTAWATSFTVRGDDVEIIRLPDISVFASPDLTVDVTPRSANIKGVVIVPEAMIILDKVPESAVGPSLDTVIHGRDDQTSASAFDYNMDIVLSIKEEAKLQGFGLTAGLAGELDLQGKSATPTRGTGNLQLVNGNYEIYGQTLEIERGRLTFAGPLDNPALDFRATRLVEDTKVGIEISGFANRPRSTLFSDPAMSEGAILSYLITGRPLEDAGSEDGTQIAQAAIALGLSNSVVGQIGATLGLDELSFAGGSEDGQVLAGKRLNKNLYLQYAYGIFDKVGNVLVRYRLSDRLRVEAETGEESSLDLIYSIKAE